MKVKKAIPKKVSTAAAVWRKRAKVACSTGIIVALLVLLSWHSLKWYMVNYPFTKRGKLHKEYSIIIKKVLNLTDVQIKALRNRYSGKAREQLYYRIGRKMVPELEPMLRSISPLLSVTYGTNLTQLFQRSKVDRKFQSQANSTTMTAGDFKALAFYEDVLDARDRVTQAKAENTPLKDIPLEYRIKYAQYMGIRLPKRMEGIWPNDTDWFLGGGRLTHRSLTQENNPYLTRFVKSHAVAITGLFYYPPGGYAEWHTNRGDAIGWRLYYVRTSTPRQSWFRYKPYGQDKTYTAADGVEHYNMFYLDNAEDKVLWHSVYSDTHRFSIGFHVPPDFIYAILARLEGWDVKHKVPY